LNEVAQGDYRSNVHDVSAVPCFSVRGFSSFLSRFNRCKPFRASSELVVLHVSVRDKKGQPIEHLSQDAFAVLEDGKPRPIAVFMAEDEPVTIGLLIDNSISMQRLRESRDQPPPSPFARASRPEDEVLRAGIQRTRAARAAGDDAVPRAMPPNCRPP
jgi:hypothetical protein